MKRIPLILLLCALFSVGSAQDMTALFTTMPDHLAPQLETAWRKDLADLYLSGKEARLQNTMNGFSTLHKLTPDYLLLQTTERSTIELKLLPLVNNTHILCLITTVNAPIPDSRVSFFSTDWEPLDAADLFTPVSADWFIKENTDYPEALSRLDMDLIHYQLHPDTATLTATFTTPLYLSKEEQEKVAPHIKEGKVYGWKRYKFE
ncbi:hypothetical protein Barb7_00335 [Bacteroidales bacterium Barb7]|nr:hypothetical protein Barb7_00335 [Bacteroidales bacterium Barb7]